VWCGDDDDDDDDERLTELVSRYLRWFGFGSRLFFNIMVGSVVVRANFDRPCYGSCWFIIINDF
jgi:hypothetical protein